MVTYRTSQRTKTKHPIVAFLLVASFGILFVGCGGNEPVDIAETDEFSFTMEDIAKVKEMASNGTSALVPRLELAPLQEGEGGPPVIDVGSIEKFTAIRTGEDSSKDLFRVTNAFLNVRSAPNVTASQYGRLERSETVEVLEFVNAGWAKISYGAKEGYVASRYISKLVSEEQLTEERKKYDGLYFVDFGFLNVRKEADTNSEKIGELPGQSFVRPLTTDDVWARIPFEEGDGYVAVQYLTPFIPNFLVRQSAFELPILHYRLVNEEIVDGIPQHIAALKEDGYTFWTMNDLYQLLLTQEERDVRLDPKIVILAVSDITPENIDEVSSVLRASSVSATLFLSSQYLGSGGIDANDIATLVANGFDLQAGGHTGDDLRSLTNAQVALELSQSKQMLEEITKRDVIAIGYPLGGVNDRVARKAAEVGYLLGLSTAEDVAFNRTQLLRLPSIVIRAGMSASDVLTSISS